MEQFIMQETRSGPAAVQGPQDVIKSRAGYAVPDLLKSLDTNLATTGVIATGKLLHYTADLICSGGIDLWQRLCWEHVIDHVGLASPRIFVYLKRRFAELDTPAKLLPTEEFYRHIEVQKRIAEVVLVIQSCPRKTKVKIPQVPPETHKNDLWQRSAFQAPPSAAVARVWKAGDRLVLRHVGDEIMAAVATGALEKLLFWVKWAYEEDSLLKKELKGAPGLTIIERGTADVPTKKKTDVGFFFAEIFMEAYKELASKGLVRMHEEFQTIIELYNKPDPRLTSRRRLDLLALMVQIVCEVPRWKVPAAPSLVTDPIAMKRAADQAPTFFKELLMHPELKKQLPRALRKARPKKLLDAKKQKQQDQMDAYEAALDSYFSKL
jgi:hypothetical protein